MADIVDTLKDSSLFTIFVTALDAAGLTDKLHEPGPFTVFAPTDAAFAKLPPGKLDLLMRETDRLRGILLFHIVEGEFTAEDLDEQTQLPTLQGESVGLHAGEGMDVDVAGFTKTDIEAVTVLSML